MSKYSVNFSNFLLLSEAVSLQGINNRTMYSNKMNVNKINILGIKILS